MKTLWKTINGYENYEVSTKGAVRRTDTKKYLKLQNNAGYKTANLFKNGKCKNIGVHRLVAEAFIPNPENKSCVHHLDENRSNNHLENLEWVTHVENIKYAADRIRATMLQQKNGTPIYCHQVRKVFYSQAEAARELNISTVGINAALTGKQRTTKGYTFEYYCEE